MSSIKTLWLSLTTLILGVVLYALIQAIRPHDGQSSALPPPSEAHGSQLVYLHYNREGSLDAQFQIDKFWHQEDQQAQFTHPAGFIQVNPRARWHITADTGEYDTIRNIPQIELKGHVVAQYYDNKQLEISLYTEKMAVDPHSLIAKTTTPVLIKQSNTVLESEGILINMKAGTAQLLSNTRSTYYPHGKNPPSF